MEIIYDIGRRLKEERVRLKLTQQEVADLVGITRQSQAKYEKGESSPDLIYMDKLIDIGFNAYYIMSGQKTYHPLSHLEKEQKSNISDNLKEKSSSYIKRDKNNKAGHRSPTLENKAGLEIHDLSMGTGKTLSAFTRIPLYDATASAGKGSYVLDESTNDSLIFKKEWIHNELHNSPGNLYLINIEGESMEPSLRPGDVVLVDHSDNTAKCDGIYVLRMGDALLVKRLQRLPGDIIRASSDNPAYEPFNIDLKKDGHEISIIGRVVWSGRRQ